MTWGRVENDPRAGREVRAADFSWSLDREGRHEVNVYGLGQRVVFSNEGWRALRNLLEALHSIESEGEQQA